MEYTEFPKLIEFQFSEFGEHSSIYKVVSSQRHLDQVCESYRPADSPRFRFSAYHEVDWCKLSLANFPLTIHDFLVLIKGTI